jgi:cytoskeletal protein CcmA (bactofilin family)
LWLLGFFIPIIEIFFTKNNFYMFKMLSNEQILTQTENQLSAQFSSYGFIKSRQNLHIVGRVEGDIECEETVFVAENAEILGQIKAKNALIYGKIHSDIFIKNIAAIGSKAQILAQLYCHKLIIAAAAALPNGCKIM